MNSLEISETDGRKSPLVGNRPKRSEKSSADLPNKEISETPETPETPKKETPEPPKKEIPEPPKKETPEIPLKQAKPLPSAEAKPNRKNSRSLLLLPKIDLSQMSKDKKKVQGISVDDILLLDVAETGKDGSQTERPVVTKKLWLRNSQNARRVQRKSLLRPGLLDLMEIEIPGVRQPSNRPSNMNLTNQRRFSHIRRRASDSPSPEEVIAIRKAIATWDMQKNSRLKTVEIGGAQRATASRPAPFRKRLISTETTKEKRVRPPVSPNFKPPQPRPVYEISRENLTELPVNLIPILAPVVTKLVLCQNQFEQITQDFGQFTKLEELDLSSNHLSLFPEAILKCTSLKSLLIGGNDSIAFSGNLRSLKNLTILGLSRNKLVELPEAICDMINLQHMDISFNKIKKLNPRIGALSNLFTLVAKNNQLIKLPKEIGQCTSLSYLDLKENQLVSLPDEIGCLRKLEELCISTNHLTSLPTTLTLRNLSALYKLDAFRNFISEFDCFFEGAGDSAFEEIHFGRNRLRSLPDNFWKCKFVLIDLRNNDLTELSPLVGSLYQLAIFDLANNRISNIPPELGNCENLVTLNLFNNAIEKLPDEFRQICRRIRHLYLGYNHLKEFPFLEDTYYESLEELFLNGNPIEKISPSISENCPVLHHLFLNNTELTEIPPELGYLPELEQLDLSHNKLKSLPIEILQLRSLSSLDLSHNNLVNTMTPHLLNTTTEAWDITDWSFDLLSIDIIDLSFNSLTHPPRGLDALMQRGVQVNLENNPLSGSLPAISKYKVGWSEMVGRRPSQEDALSISGRLGNFENEVTFFGLFDGHGGRAAAEFSAVKFPEVLTEKLKIESDTLKAISDAFHSVNSAFREFASSSKDSMVKHCGSTGIVILIIGDDVFCGNVGDARAVMYTGGDNVSTNSDRPFGSSTLCSDFTVVRLSEDHKPDLEEDRIRHDGGYVVDGRVNGFLSVSRSVGDYYALGVNCETSAFQFPLPKHPDAFIIIGCDGVWDELSDEEVCSIVHHYKEEKNLHKISATVRDYSYFLGSDDNISVMIIKL